MAWRNDRSYEAVPNPFQLVGLQRWAKRHPLPGSIAQGALFGACWVILSMVVLLVGASWVVPVVIGATVGTLFAAGMYRSNSNSERS